MTRRRRKRSEIISFNGIYNLNGMVLAIYSKNIYILLGDSILEYKLYTKNIIPKVIDTNTKNIIIPMDIDTKNIAILQEYIKSKNNISKNIAVSKEKKEKERENNISKEKEKEKSEEQFLDLGLFKNPFENDKIEIEQNPKTFRVKKMTEQIIAYLNKKAGKSFRANNPKTQKLIGALLKDGYKIDDFKFVIDSKCEDWLFNPKFSKYLRPSTLFNYNHFDNYVNEKPAGYRSEEEELKAIEKMMNDEF